MQNKRRKDSEIIITENWPSFSQKYIFKLLWHQINTVLRILSLVLVLRKFDNKGFSHKESEFN